MIIGINFVSWIIDLFRLVIAKLDTIIIFGLRFSVFWVVLGFVAFLIGFFNSIIARNSVGVGAKIISEQRKKNKKSGGKND